MGGEGGWWIIRLGARRQKSVESRRVMLKNAIAKLVEGQSLSESESYDAVKSIMEGAATPVQIAAFLTALRMKGETVEEIRGPPA